jgi:hypothetical protein
MAIKAALPCAAAFAAALMSPVAAPAQNSTPAPQAEPSSGPSAQAPAQASATARPTAPAPTDGAAARSKFKPAAKSEDGKESENERRAGASAMLALEPGATRSECAWVGKRVVSLLVRDDVDTATDFTRFYAMFHCPETHIGATLACVVSDPGAAREGAALTEHVDLCWANPSTRLLPQKPPNPDKPAPSAVK